MLLVVVNVWISEMDFFSLGQCCVSHGREGERAGTVFSFTSYGLQLWKKLQKLQNIIKV